MIVDPYVGFSQVYDRVMTHEKYPRWEKFVRDTWHKHNFSPASLVDLACGTGNNTVRYPELLVFGVDKSTQMLEKAREKESNAHFINASFLDYRLPRKVDAAICLDFSANYILNPDDFLAFVLRTYIHLNPGGMFIFDIKPLAAYPNSEKKEMNSKFSYIWKCEVDPPLVNIEVQVGIGHHSYTENHVERAYTMEEMRRIVANTPFKNLGFFDDSTDREGTDESNLVQIVLQK